MGTGNWCTVILILARGCALNQTATGSNILIVVGVYQQLRLTLPSTVLVNKHCAATAFIQTDCDLLDSIVTEMLTVSAHLIT